MEEEADDIHKTGMAVMALEHVRHKHAVDHDLAAHTVRGRMLLVDHIVAHRDNVLAAVHPPDCHVRLGGKGSRDPPWSEAMDQDGMKAERKAQESQTGATQASGPSIRTNGYPRRRGMSPRGTVQTLGEEARSNQEP